MSSKETYVSVKEPYIVRPQMDWSCTSVKESYLSANRTDISEEEPRIQPKSPAPQ